MYAQPKSFEQLLDKLTQILKSKENISKAKEKAKLIIYVELTLYLAERLGLDSEPLTVGWVLLSRMPLYHLILNNLTPEQRHMQANAAVIVPLSSRYAWESALVQYRKDIPSDICLYRVASTRLDDQMINVCRQEPCPDPLRVNCYETILSEQLVYQGRNQPHTEVNETYKIHVKTSDGTTHTGRVTITEQMQKFVAKDPTWFDSDRPRLPLTISIDELLPTAQFLDEHEQSMGEHVHWVHDLNQLRFQRVSMIDGSMSLDEENTYPLVIDGMVHLPGMVSAGKTTLAKLIIAHCIRLDLDMRITLVVGDSNSAIEIANQVNNWFYDSPAGEEVAAVPLLGATQREIHLERMLESRHYQHSLKKGRPHWGERWLMPVCPLASQIKWDERTDVSFPAGSEPCEGLFDEPRKTKKRGSRHICPLFSMCPSKQMYRDMPRAKLWVTTPGALSQGSLPLHLDARIFELGDLVYEQSDLVIFDEVETIVEWYDRTFARREELSNGGNGLLDRLGIQIAPYWASNRVLPTNQHEWVVTINESLKALGGVLSALDNPNQQRVVKNWVKRGYFAPNQLAYRLARRLAGLKEWDDAKTSMDVRKENEQRTKEIFEAFDELLNWPPDPIRRQIHNTTGLSKIDELARLMQTMNNFANDMTDKDLSEQCRTWVLDWYPDIDERLSALKERLQSSGDKFDRNYSEKALDRSADEIASRLQFMLMVALLDRHLHIILQGWHNKPEALNILEPFGQIPRGMRHILPLPLTGPQYGFIPDTNKSNRGAANRLSLFIYTNIGRSYMLNYHRLRQDFDGERGPHVLALSGTSYLPHSTLFHVDLPPVGILLPPHKTEQAIKNSRFIWHPFVNERGTPIQISGVADKQAQLRQLVTAMLAEGAVEGGFIGEVLRWLELQGKQSPEDWQDRARILLLTNSYEQSHTVATALREGWRDAADTIYDLKRGKGEDFEIDNQVQRADIEQFATTGGRILVAPMQSIGRGFNILNSLPEPTAAFGAVFFLTRPMNQPNDMETVAQELNRYALDWANDPTFPAWGEDTLYRRALKARDSAVTLRRSILQRKGYTDLNDDAQLHVCPRSDLAATTAGRIVQAVGRLLRGGVPFRAYFIDAAWSPDLAETGDINRIESEETSLLTALINILEEYAHQDVIGQNLYGGLSEALTTTENRDNN